MEQFSRTNPAADAVNNRHVLPGTKTSHPLNKHLEDTDMGSEVNRMNCGKSHVSILSGEKTDTDSSSVYKSSSKRGRVRGNKPRGTITKKDKGKTAGTTTQAPPNHYQQHYPHGYPVSDYPQGMMPPIMMPIQPGTVPPPMMPYMMPPSYHGFPPSSSRGKCYDSSYDYSSHSSLSTASSCSTICAEPCEGFAKLVLKTVDYLASSVTTVMEYGEDLCDPVTLVEETLDYEDLCDPVMLVQETLDYEGMGVDQMASNLSLLCHRPMNSSTLPSCSTTQEDATLLEKIDKLYTMVTENEATGVDPPGIYFPPFEDSASAIQKNIEESESIFSSNLPEKIKVIVVSQTENADHETIEAEAKLQETFEAEVNLNETIEVEFNFVGAEYETIEAEANFAWYVSSIAVSGH
jgi:hypothetical protein